jgi:hypothetical protein
MNIYKTIMCFLLFFAFCGCEAEQPTQQKVQKKTKTSSVIAPVLDDDSIDMMSIEDKISELNSTCAFVRIIKDNGWSCFCRVPLKTGHIITIFEESNSFDNVLNRTLKNVRESRKSRVIFVTEAPQQEQKK